MSEPKVIELTEDKAEKLFAKWCDSFGEAYMMMGDFRNGGVTLKPSQPKLVHLSDLPDGTRVRSISANEWLYKEGDTLYEFKDAMGDYRQVFAHISDYVEGAAFELVPGEWLPWQGGECPWPEGVEVEVILRNGESKIIPARMIGWGHYSFTKPFAHRKGEIIAHRCTGRLLDGAKLIP